MSITFENVLKILNYKRKNKNRFLYPQAGQAFHFFYEKETKQRNQGMLSKFMLVMRFL